MSVNSKILNSKNKISGVMEYINLPMILVIVGVILSGIGAFWQSYRQNQEKIESANDRVQFETELRKRSDEITKLNQQIAQSVTGGDSFCYVQLGSANATNAIITIIQEGRYPLYDVNVRIVDLDVFDRLQRERNKELTSEDYAKADTIINAGNISPGIAYVGPTILFNGKTEVKYNIFIIARNGQFTQNLRMKYISGDWKRAVRVTKENYSDDTPDAPPTLLLERVDQDFPKNKRGEVEW